MTCRARWTGNARHGKPQLPPSPGRTRELNYRLLIRNLGILLMAFGITMIPTLVCAAAFQEWKALIAVLESMGLTLAVGVGMVGLGWRAPKQMFQRETLGMVGLGWILCSMAGALPYVFSQTLGPVDAWFESMSGLTTTGSTVIADIEACSKSILFWRSFTHFLGGMGIIVLFVAVLPYLGVGGKHLFRSESTADPRRLNPRIKETAATLWKIYFGMTVILTVALMLAGMDLYEALCHTFGTVATGGFPTKQASIGHYDSYAIELIILVFMVLAGSNFALLRVVIKGSPLSLFRDTEWRAYIGIMAVTSAFIAINLMGLRLHSPIDETHPESYQEVANYEPAEAIRQATFISVSIMTTTGYGTHNFEQWPYFSQMILVALMFVGGCAGSTGGGIKVVRVVILLKMIYWRLENSFRPKTVRPIRLGEVVVDEDAQRRVSTFLLLHLFVLGMGSIFMAGLGLPPLTAATSVITTLNNVGPGLEFVGAGHDFSKIPDAGKIFLTFCMAMGRLELYSILVLFVPGFWKHA